MLFLTNEEVFQQYFISFIYSLITFIASIILIIAGSYYKGEAKEIKNARLLSVAGAINILHILSTFWIATILSLWVQENFRTITIDEIMSAYIGFGLILPAILLFFSNGILFIAVGRYNKDNRGKLLSNAGFYYCGFIFSSAIVLGVLLTSSSELLSIDYLTSSLNILSYISLFIFIISRFLFFAYCIKLNYKTLGVSSILFLFAALFLIISQNNIFFIKILQI